MSSPFSIITPSLPPPPHALTLRPYGKWYCTYDGWIKVPTLLKHLYEHLAILLHTRLAMHNQWPRRVPPCLAMFPSLHYKETMPGLTETCPNQDVVNDRKLTDFCHFGQIIVNSDIFCQRSVTLDNFQSIISLYHILIWTCLCQFRHYFLVVSASLAR